jgi:hypothetical protein
MADPRLQDIQQELENRGASGVSVDGSAISSDDGDRLQDIQQELKNRQQSLGGAVPFWRTPSNKTTLIQQIPQLKDPKELAKATIQAVGTLGTAAVPEVSLLKGVGLAPDIINNLARAGASGAFGAMASPNAPLAGATLGAAFGAINPAISGASSAINIGKNIFNKYLNPEVPYSNFINQVSGGNTLTQNIQNLSGRLKAGYEAAKETALLPKRELMQDVGKQYIVDPTPTGKLTQEAILPGQINKGEYLSVENADQYYSGKLQDAHNNYVDDPTFENSDILRSRLFKRINTLNNRQKFGTITDSQEKELSSLINNRNSIIQDQNNFIKTLPPEYQQKYGQFNQMWKENVVPYNEAGKTIRNLKNGNLQNITPQKITNAFSFPELNPQLQKVLSDIGPSGVNNIVYNSLGRTSSASEALNMLNSLEQNKGFAPYMTPEINSLKQNIQDRIKRKNIAKWGTTGVLGAGGLYEAGRQIFGQ